MEWVIDLTRKKDIQLVSRYTVHSSMYRFSWGWHIFSSRQCSVIQSDNQPRDSHSRIQELENSREHCQNSLGRQWLQFCADLLMLLFIKLLEQHMYSNLISENLLVVFDLLALLCLLQKYHCNCVTTAWLLIFEEISDKPFRVTCHNGMQ